MGGEVGTGAFGNTDGVYALYRSPANKRADPDCDVGCDDVGYPSLALAIQPGRSGCGCQFFLLDCRSGPIFKTATGFGGRVLGIDDVRLFRRKIVHAHPGCFSHSYLLEKNPGGQAFLAKIAGDADGGGRAPCRSTGIFRPSGENPQDDTSGLPTARELPAKN